ncbi:MAG: hypothetical protein ABR548_11040 [Actinomycetota bacterium]|nr:hypothetical protein [Actinomycetota bacterium]
MKLAYGKALTRAGSLLVIAAFLVIAGATAGSAETGGNPKQAITLTCTQGTYDIVVWGNAPWVPAQDANSTLVFHPTTFGEVTRTFYPADGSPSWTETEPSDARTVEPSNGHATFACSFRLVEIFPEGTLIDDGSLTGWMSGAGSR